MRFFKKKTNNTKQKIAVSAKDKKLAGQQTPASDDSWLDQKNPKAQAAELSVDVFEDNKNIVVKSTLAGVNPEDIEVSLNNDTLTIKGKRESAESSEGVNYLLQECYWGVFERSINLSAEVDKSSIKAEIKNGILTIRMRKKSSPEKVKVKVEQV